MFWEIWKKIIEFSSIFVLKSIQKWMGFAFIIEIYRLAAPAARWNQNTTKNKILKGQFSTKIEVQNIFRMFWEMLKINTDLVEHVSTVTDQVPLSVTGVFSLSSTTTPLNWYSGMVAHHWAWPLWPPSVCCGRVRLFRGTHGDRSVRHDTVSTWLVIPAPPIRRQIQDPWASSQ